MILASGAIATAALKPQDLVARSPVHQPSGVVLPEVMGIWACWIGHSTVLMRAGGMWILTDPVMFGGYGVSVLGMTIGPSRISAPAITFEELPRPDLVLLSHAHMDHMDRRTLIRLSERWPDQIDVITAANTRDVIEDLRWKSLNEMDWCDTVRIGTVTLTAMEVRHNGWRFPGEPCRAEGYRRIGRSYNGYIIDYDGMRVVFGGDTAYTSAFRYIGQAPDLAMMPIGAYDPYPETHCTPEESLAMAEMMKARSILPIHHATFRQSQEPVSDPIRRLRRALHRSNMQLAIHGIGDTCEVAQSST